MQIWEKYQTTIYTFAWVYSESRGAGVEQKQMQRFLEFLDSVNILLPSSCLWHIHNHLWTAPDLGKAKVQPSLCSLQAPSNWSRNFTEHTGVHNLAKAIGLMSRRWLPPVYTHCSQLSLGLGPEVGKERWCEEIQ